MDTKVCSECGVEKPVSEFYRHPTSTLGVRGKCKECCRMYSVEYRLEHIEHYHELERSRGRKNLRKAHRQNSKEYRLDYNRNDRRLHPYRFAARAAVQYAIRTGKLVRMPCEVCGNEESQAHHCDYSLPLDVMWLCPVHHAEWHRNNTVKSIEDTF